MDKLEAADYFVIESEDVPVEVSARLYDVVGESRQFALLQPAVADASQNGASAGSAQIDCEKVVTRFVLLHGTIRNSEYKDTKKRRTKHEE